MRKPFRERLTRIPLIAGARNGTKMDFSNSLCYPPASGTDDGTESGTETDDSAAYLSSVSFGTE